MAAMFVSLVLMLTFLGAARSYGQECISAGIENAGNDNRLVQLHISNSEGCVSVYGIYVQLERNGSMRILSAPSGWTYGESETAVFWVTETDPINSDGKVFGMQLQSQKPYTLHWIALDQTLSPIAEGILIGE